MELILILPIEMFMGINLLDLFLCLVGNVRIVRDIPVDGIRRAIQFVAERYIADVRFDICLVSLVNDIAEVDGSVARYGIYPDAINVVRMCHGQHKVSSQ